MRAFLVCLGLAFAVSACTAPPPEASTRDAAETCGRNCRQARDLVTLAKADLREEKYGDAILKCQAADALVDAYGEAKYCVLAAGVGTLAEKADALIRLVSGQLVSPAYQPALNVKQIFASMVSDIEETLILIDGYTYEVAALENPTFQIADFPIGIDVSDLIRLFGATDIVVLDDIEVNLRGTWGLSEALLIGAAVNTVMAGLDYALAHELVLESTELGFDETQDLAHFLVDNPRLLSRATDEQSKQRLGGGDSDKGLRMDMLAALSYLTGRGESLMGAAPANPGLPAAIAAAAAAPATDAIVRYFDENGDGFPEKIEVPFVRDASRRILGRDGEPLISTGIFSIPLQADTWSAIFGTLKALASNIDTGEPAAVSLHAALRLLVRDLAPYQMNFRMLRKPPPDTVALDAGAFLQEPKVIGELLPHLFWYTYYSFDGATPVVAYDMAMETELWGYDGIVIEKAGRTYRRNVSDYGHFNYAVPDPYLFDAYMSAYQFTGYASPPAAIAPDGVVPTLKTPKLWYISWQDPTFGGLLQGDPSFATNGTGGKFTAMNQAHLNRWMNKVFRYYCLDFELGTLNGLFENGWAYEWNENPIEECTQQVE